MSGQAGEGIPPPATATTKPSQGRWRWLRWAIPVGVCLLALIILGVCLGTLLPKHLKSPIQLPNSGGSNGTGEFPTSTPTVFPTGHTGSTSSDGYAYHPTGPRDHGHPHNPTQPQPQPTDFSPTTPVNPVNPYPNQPPATPPQVPQTPANPPTGHPPNVPCAIVPKVSYTFYGYPDNDPPGADIAYDCGRGYTAGGIGTYANPLTFATAPGEFAMCELVYSPYLRKYLLHEDYCESCTRDWADRHHPVWHVDIWLGRNSTTEAHEQLSCENRLTPDGQSQVVIRNPERNLPVDEMTFYAGGKASCGVEHVYPQYAVQEFC